MRERERENSKSRFKPGNESNAMLEPTFNPPIYMQFKAESDGPYEQLSLRERLHPVPIFPNNITHTSRGQLKQVVTYLDSLPERGSP